MIPDSMAAMKLNPVGPSTAIGADDLLDLLVPTNARWRVHQLRVLFTAKAGVGSRDLLFDLFNEDDQRIVRYLAATGAEPTATQTAILYLGPHLPGEITNGANINVEIGLYYPLDLPQGWYFQVKDDDGIDNTDTVQFDGTVEEWIEE